jgi:uncharacterized damage-inducible protein DinB
MHRPESNEYAPDYEKYVSLIPDGDIVSMLQTQIAETRRMLNSLSEAKAEQPYAPGKWTIKQMLGHLIDSERIFAYRALRIARNDKTPLAGFEQDDFVTYGNHNACTLADLIAEFESVRQTSIFLFKHMPEDAWTRQGTASNNPVTVRALAWIMAGHEIHHQKLLKQYSL